MVWLGATSVLLLIAVVMGVALPRVYRRRNLGQIQAERPVEDIVSTDVDSGMSAPLNAPVSSVPKDRKISSTVAQEPFFRVRYGRLALFSLGVIALLSSFILVFISLFSSLSWAWPVLTGAIAVMAVVILRYLAVRDCRVRRAGRRSQESMVGEKRPEKPAVQQVAVPSRGRGQKPVSYATKSLRYARTHRSLVRPQLEGTAGSEELTLREKIEPRFETVHAKWQPTEVPQPTYLGLAEVPRELPQPIEIPAYEKSESKTLTQAQQVAETAGKLKLDEILQRRRAS